MSAPTLFDQDVAEHDPLRPGLDDPTPLETVMRLTRSDRERRLAHLIEQAHAIYDDGIATHGRGREIAASCVLFSGGNDSTTLAHLFRGRATHAIHANTTIGIEATRQFVRDTCAAWGLPLVEETGNETYRDLVLGKVTTRAGEPVWPGGFPGPGAHGLMYQRLKERALDRARHTLGIANSKTRAGVFIAGRRRQESKRRDSVPLYEDDGTVIWVSPIAMWTKLDLNTYRLVHDDVPRNQVADLLHMSGECLCGAFAHPGELEEVRIWFPEVAAEIDDLAAEVSATGVVPAEWCRWGHGLGKPSGAGRLCSSCDARFTGMDALFDDDAATHQTPGHPDLLGGERAAGSDSPD